MVIVPEAAVPVHVAETPGGKPFAPDTPAFNMPVTPVVAIVMGVIAVLMHTVGDEEGGHAAQYVPYILQFSHDNVSLLQVEGYAP